MKALRSGAGRAGRALPYTVAALAAAAFLWFFIPVAAGVLNIGNGLALAACGATALAAGAYPRLWERAGRRRRALARAYRALALLLCACLTWAGVVTGWMAGAVSAAPPEGAVVLVLGSQVRGTQPSLDLQNRIDAAAAYLRAHPGAVCIASGGQGDGEDVSEAQAIAASLTEQGVGAERIFLEDASTSTEENMAFSAALIEAEGLPREVAAVTDEYHQYRAACLAREVGLTPYAVPVSTPWFLFPACYARELLAVTWMKLGL